MILNASLNAPLIFSEAVLLMRPLILSSKYDRTNTGQLLGELREAPLKHTGAITEQLREHLREQLREHAREELRQYLQERLRGQLREQLRATIREHLRGVTRSPLQSLSLCLASSWKWGCG